MRVPFQCSATLMLSSSVLASFASNQAVLVDDAAAAAQITANPSVVEQYKQEFWEWTFSRRFPQLTANGWCSGCDQSPDCCPMGGWFAIPNPTSTSQKVIVPPTTSAAATATVTITQPCNCAYDCDSASSTPRLPDSTSWSKLALPTTILSSGSVWQTIFRNTTPTSTTSAAASPTTRTEPNSSLSPESPKDITETYYSFTLQGHHPFTLPIIIQDGSGTPITLLASAYLNQQLSFISSSLLSQLNLTSQLLPAPNDLTSARLTQLLGFYTAANGTIFIDVLAGKNDRHLPGIQFIVFEPPVENEGLLLPDVIVGMEFLNRASALRLSDEYAGVVARDGLGIVVQRVYRSDSGRVGDKRHEL